MLSSEGLVSGPISVPEASCLGWKLGVRRGLGLGRLELSLEAASAGEDFLVGKSQNRGPFSRSDLRTQI